MNPIAIVQHKRLALWCRHTGGVILRHTPRVWVMPMLRVFVRSGYGYLPLSCAAHARTLVVAEGDYRRRLPDHLRRNPRAISIAYPECGAFIASQHERVGDMRPV